jgi:T5orf172 domain
MQHTSAAEAADTLPPIHPTLQVVPAQVRERSILKLGEGNTHSASRAKLNYLWALAHQSKNHISREACAVYVIGSIIPACVKIGIAGNPARRLAELQTGNPDFLFLYRVFWVDTFDIAERVERLTHRSIGLKWRRLAGEWFECPVTIAHEEIVQQLDAEQLDYVSLTPCQEGMA